MSSSAFQIEGAWNVSGRGPSIFDEISHQIPSPIQDNSTADIACDSYHLHKEDVKLLKDLGVNFYRFSISWSRILTNGLPNSINPDGIRYYNELIDELIANGIIPMVTLHHFDTPLEIFESYRSKEHVKFFVDYARVAFDHFGDRVKYWITINEPSIFCTIILHKTLAPDYQCGHILLLAHAEIYHLYQKYYKAKQGGMVSLSLQSRWFEPATRKKQDIEAAERLQQFEVSVYPTKYNLFFQNVSFSLAGLLIPFMELVIILK